MSSTVFKGISASLLQKTFSLPHNIVSNNPAFTRMLVASAAPPAQSVLSSLALALTGGVELTQLTSGMILTNILGMLKLGNSKTYTAIKLIGPCLILVGGVYQFSQRMSFVSVMARAVVASLTDRVTASVVVPADSPLNRDVLGWLASQGLGKNARSLILTTTNGKGMFGQHIEPDQSAKQEPLTFIPSFGETRFGFKGHRMVLIRKEGSGEVDEDGKFVKLQTGEGDPTQPQNFTLTCFPTFRGTAPIKEFLNSVRDFGRPKSGPVTKIHRPMVGSQSRLYWSATQRPSRAIEGVVMEAATKKSLVDDIEYYLSQQCKAFYQTRGIPYRRGYLFYGPPGTGKTSFAVAMAGFFSLPVFMFSLSDSELNDNQLADLFTAIPSRCVLLLEDVDSAGLSRESMTVNADGTKKTANKGITLSGLLNCLDGPASVDGRLLCMTSNSPDSLDPALVRRGRCDVKILFGYTCPEVSTQMFKNIYTKSAVELYAGEIDHAASHDLPQLAASFASKIPADSNITPAECQAWLLTNRVNPLAAVNGTAAWAGEIIENKSRGANVAKFSNEINGPTKANATDTSLSEATSTPSSPAVAHPATTLCDMSPPTPPSSQDTYRNVSATQIGISEDDSSGEDEYDSADEADYGDFMEELGNCHGDPEMLRNVMAKYPDFDF
jgi:chaperone BCS1